MNKIDYGLLLIRMSKGDKEAFRKVYERNKRVLYKFEV